MLAPFLQRIEILWWDLIINALSRFTPLKYAIRMVYRFWPGFLRTKEAKMLLVTAIGGFAAGMLLAQLSLR